MAGSGPIVNVNVVADTKQFSNSMKKVGDDTDGFSKALKGVGVAAAAAFAVAGAAAIAYGVSAVKAAAEAEAINRGLENAVKNAGLFGGTAKDIGKATDALDEHSKTLGELIGVDDELFNTIKTGWLAVPSLANLGTKGINRLAEITADVAAGTGKDLKSIALAFTKVAGDTETALSKLTRQGIVLDDAQKATYESLLATNGEADAQAFLIDELGKKYAGAAAATADPFARLDVIFGNLSESIGLTFLPILEDTIPKIQEFVESLESDPEFQQFLADMGLNFQNLLNWLPGAVDEMASFGRDVLPVVSAFFPFINEALKLLGTIFGDIANTDPASSTNDFAGAMKNLAEGINGVAGAFSTLRDGWNSLPPLLKSNFFEVVGALASGPSGKIGGKGFGELLFGIGPGGLDNNVATPFAEGGIVLPRPGGTLAQIGEAGQAEAVIPLDRLETMMGKGSGTTVIVQGNVGWSPQQLADIVDRKQRQAMALAGLNGIVGVR